MSELVQTFRPCGSNTRNRSPATSRNRQSMASRRRLKVPSSTVKINRPRHFESSAHDVSTLKPFRTLLSLRRLIKNPKPSFPRWCPLSNATTADLIRWPLARAANFQQDIFWPRKHTKAVVPSSPLWTRLSDQCSTFWPE